MVPAAAIRGLRHLAIAVLDRLSPRTRIHFRGDYAAWEDAAAACTGYGDGLILERVRAATREVVTGRAAFERDSVLFSDPECNWPLLALLYRQQAERAGAVTVLDFGGSLGSTYHQHRAWLDGIPGLRWCVVEQPHFAACGKAEFETDRLKFYDALDPCLETERITFALFSSVLPYLPDPRQVLAAVARAAVPCLMIDQALVWADGGEGERIVVQRVPARIYEAAYPARICATSAILAPLLPTYRLTASERGYETPVVVRRPWRVAQYRRFVLERAQ